MHSLTLVSFTPSSSEAAVDGDVRTDGVAACAERIRSERFALEDFKTMCHLQRPEGNGEVDYILARASGDGEIVGCAYRSFGCSNK